MPRRRVSVRKIEEVLRLRASSRAPRRRSRPQTWYFITGQPVQTSTSIHGTRPAPGTKFPSLRQYVQTNLPSWCPTPVCSVGLIRLKLKRP
jgi:hypothetical protein